jgi:hypothetical protein
MVKRHCLIEQSIEKQAIPGKHGWSIFGYFMKDALTSIPFHVHIRDARLQSTSKLFGDIDIYVRLWSNENKATIGSTS